MYYGLSIYDYKLLLLLLGSALFEFLRPEDKRRALQGCTETNNKVCQIFSEVGGAVRRESATENLLNLKQKRLLDITCEIYCLFFFSIKSLISWIQSMSGT